jgi:hypothetical protein
MAQKKPDLRTNAARQEAGLPLRSGAKSLRHQIYMTRVFYARMERLALAMQTELLPGITHSDGSINLSAVVLRCIHESAEKRGIDLVQDDSQNGSELSPSSEAL